MKGTAEGSSLWLCDCQKWTIHEKQKGTEVQFTMNAPPSHLPLQPSRRASFHGDLEVVNALEFASITSGPPISIPAQSSGVLVGSSLATSERKNLEPAHFVVVNLDDNQPETRPLRGEASHAAKPNKLSLDHDVELGLKIGDRKHVSNESEDDAADGETICRVCHLGLYSGNRESMELGCACKQDLALCHRDCAEEWFKVRGNRICEICGQTVKNVRPLESEETNVARLEVDGAQSDLQRVVVRTTAVSRFRFCWQKQLIRNSLLACLVVVFMVPWFFRIAYFTM